MFNKTSTLTIAVLLLFSLLIGCTPDGAIDEPTVQPTLIVESVTPEPMDSPTEPAPTEAPSLPATPTATAPATSPSSASLDDFVGVLTQAIATRDFATMQTLMADPFSVGYWLSEGVSYSPAEAAQLLETSLLPDGSQVTWADPGMDLASLLQGQPPASFLGPDRQVAAALLSYGWGEDGSAEAIQFITQQPDGTFRWELMLYSGFGFTGLPTDVAAVLINADEATFYSGPGESYEPVATVFGGMTYPVIGVSLDQQWWRLTCYDDNNVLMPQCWVSADPAISSPTAAP